MPLACGSGQKPFRDHENSPRHIPVPVRDRSDLERANLSASYDA